MPAGHSGKWPIKIETTEKLVFSYVKFYKVDGEFSCRSTRLKEKRYTSVTPRIFGGKFTSRLPHQYKVIYCNKLEYIEIHNPLRDNYYLWNRD